MDSMKEVTCIPHGAITLPPSKSISHRALICAALAKGESTIQNISLAGDDVSATLSCLEKLGISYRYEREVLKIQGGINSPPQELLLDCGESGSTLRFLIPIALLWDAPIIITGRRRLMERPLGEYIGMLERNGCIIDFDGSKLSLKGPLKPGLFTLPGNVSSQFITGLLLALPILDGDSEIVLTTPLESKAYVSLTTEVMHHYGVSIDIVNQTKFLIKGNQVYTPCQYTVEADFSAAAFFLVAGALGCDVNCLGLNPSSLQGDKEIMRIIERCGGRIITDVNGGISATAGELTPITVDVRDIPDLAPPIAALLCFCEGHSRIVGAERLRAKESDRLHALTTQLNALGADITEGKDFLDIKGVKELRGGTVDPQNDHRIAMAAAVASIRSRGVVKVLNPDCVSKSYPEFWEDFCGIQRRT